jgi:PadR family transcriptional regulator, regulatory protein PadR
MKSVPQHGHPRFFPLDNLGECRYVSINTLGDAMPLPKLDLLQGTLDMLILKTLTGGPMHGYAIVRSNQEISQDALRVEEGALYPALHRMELRGFVDSQWGASENNRRAKFYRLTAAGRKKRLSTIACNRALAR